MRFLADESCDMAVVRALILLTEDKDFGQLVHAATGVSAGVMLLRFPRTARSDIGRAAAGAVTALGDRLKTAFVVVEPGRFRITELKP